MFEYPGKYYEIIRSSFRNLEKESQFISELAPAGGEILDIGCGTGTNLRALNELGFRCVGVDQSSSFIDYAMRASEGMSNIDFHCCRAVEFETEKKFDVITSLFVALNYMPYEDLRPLFEKCRSWLKPGGKFVVDVAYLLNFADRYEPYIVAHHRSGETLITRLVTHRVFPHSGNWRHEETILVRDGDKPVEMYHDQYNQQVVTEKELISILSDAGFSTFERFGAFSRQSKPSYRGDLILVAS